MLANDTLHKGMYNIMQEWYNYINDNIHIQADLIGKYCFALELGCLSSIFTSLVPILTNLYQFSPIFFTNCTNFHSQFDCLLQFIFEQRLKLCMNV